MENKPLTLGSMARRLGVTTAWLRAEAAAGRIPSVPADKTFLFDPDAVERLLLERAGRKGVANGQ